MGRTISLREREREKKRVVSMFFFLYIFCKDGKLKVKLDNDNTKTFRLIKPCDLQLYEGVSLSSNSESQTEEQSFEY